jgi:hypothetical protein
MDDAVLGASDAGLGTHTGVEARTVPTAYVPGGRRWRPPPLSAAGLAPLGRSAWCAASRGLGAPVAAGAPFDHRRIHVGHGIAGVRGIAGQPTERRWCHGQRSTVGWAHEASEPRVSSSTVL